MRPFQRCIFRFLPRMGLPISRRNFIAMVLISVAAICTYTLSLSYYDTRYSKKMSVLRMSPNYTQGPRLLRQNVTKALKIQSFTGEIVSGRKNKKIMEVKRKNTLLLSDLEKGLYPHCESKAKWLSEYWRTDGCYASYGVDGSPWSVMMYLSEVEGFCPRSAAYLDVYASLYIDKNRNNTDYVRNEEKSKIETGLPALLELLKDSEYAWIRMRITRMWPKWTAAITNLQKKQDLSNRKKKKIWLHLGLINYGFAEKAFSGGPLGELVQWSDLIAGLYILGHQLIITSWVDQVPRLISTMATSAGACQVKQGLPDQIYTDIDGFRHMRNHINNGYSTFGCLLRILDSFGTEPEFNWLPFAKQRDKLSMYGGNDLNPRQFFTMFPHTPDNSCLGFVVEDLLNVSNGVEMQKQNIAVVYGKDPAFWKGKEKFIDTVHRAGFEIHGTVALPNGGHSDELPQYVVNHGLLHGSDIHKLLAQAKLFLGLGFPFEGPAPLEAVANGAVYINPMFDIPHSYGRDGKPTERNITSQHDYAEKFIGEPYVYTINIDDADAVRNTCTIIQQQMKFTGYVPYEYTEEGFLQRINAYIEHQEFCPTDYQAGQWPPESEAFVLLGKPGGSCNDVCWDEDLICEPSYFKTINSFNQFSSFNVTCASETSSTHIYYPAFDIASNTCVLQDEGLLFSCAGNQDNLLRLCPCRNYIKGQTALCVGCET